MRRPHRRASGWLVGLALDSYPSWWKERYRDEVGSTCDDLLADGRSSVRLAAGLLVSALAARLLGTGMPPIASLYRRRRKAALVTETLFVLAMLPLAVWIDFSTGVKSVTQHTPGHVVARGPGWTRRIFSTPPASVGGHLASFCANSLLFFVLPVTVLLLANAWLAVRPEFAKRGTAWLAMWIAPAFFFVASIGLSVWRNPFLAVAARAALPLVIVSAFLIVVVVARIADPTHVVQAVEGGCLSVAAVLLALGVIGWTIGLDLQPTPNMHLSYTFTHATLAPWSILLASVMGVAAMVAVTSYVQARGCWSVASRLATVEH